jgi:hypothetical protein
MDSLKSPSTGSMTFSLVVMICLVALCLILGFLLKEPKTFLTQPAPKSDNKAK